LRKSVNIFGLSFKLDGKSANNPITRMITGKHNETFEEKFNYAWEKKKLDMVTSDLLFYEFSNYKSSLDNGFLYILQKNHWKSSKFLSSSSSLFCYDEGYFKVTKGFRICIFLKLNIIKLKNSLFSASDAVILF
jgi:hypothetical protein